MTCAEFEAVLPEMLEGEPSSAQEEHLQSCSACLSLAGDLSLISQHARSLPLDADPSARVWNSIEIALRQEGLIHPPPRPAAVASFVPRWRPAWALSLAAAMLLAFGALLYERGTGRPELSGKAAVSGVSTASSQLEAAQSFSPEDERVLAALESRPPAVRATYEGNIQRVNAYIRDAETWAKSDPNDEEAQQYLMGAYEQRAVIYQMALDHSLSQ
jgi:hypothetical protein